ncbi:LCCL domain-containing protein [Dankookia sp. GCM10030260]|uniref:LCCL domain-containing protein n=1 Tax=Dankookia sp. GCM10030260 TaxID=3273390 RepID=UPI00360E2241
MRRSAALLLAAGLVAAAASRPEAAQPAAGQPAAGKPARAAPRPADRPPQGKVSLGKGPPGKALAGKPAPARPAPEAELPASPEPPRVWPPPGRFPLPACPALLAAIAEGVQACRCAPGATATGVVAGSGPYAGTAAACRAGLHAGAIGPRGGDLVIRVLPLPGEAPGSARNGVAAQPGRLDGRGYAVLPGTPGQLDWARRLAAALAAPNPPPRRMPGRAETLIPLPLPQVADLGPLLDPAARDRPGLGRLAPPVLMPALWRSPTRPADAGPPPGAAVPPAFAPLPVPAPPGPVAGAAQVLGPVRLLVAGVALDLADVMPGEGAEPRLLGDFLARHGGSAACEPVAAAARCRTFDGIDLAEAALYNGLARVTLEASDAYRYAERAAREARRGIWKAGSR